MSMHLSSESDQYSQDGDFDSNSGETDICKGECEVDDEDVDTHLSFSSEDSPTLNDKIETSNTERCRSVQVLVTENKENRTSSASQLSRRKREPIRSRLIELAKPRSILTLPKPPPTRKKITSKSVQEFVLRQETLEKLRQTKMVQKKLELEYEGNVNKRKCRSCKVTQSFDEFYRNKNICQCGTKYGFPSVFHLQRFEQRIFQSRCKRQQKIDEICEDRLFILYKPSKSRHQQALIEKAALRANGNDFLKRMQEDLAKRKQHLEGLCRRQAEEGHQRNSMATKRKCNIA
eukprot:scaffold248_cov263-Chaetoceros_neogracile.AAC.14